MKHTYQSIAIDWGVHEETVKRWVAKIVKTKHMELERASKRTVRIPQVVVDQIGKSKRSNAKTKSSK